MQHAYHEDTDPDEYLETRFGLAPDRVKWQIKFQAKIIGKIFKQEVKQDGVNYQFKL